MSTAQTVQRIVRVEINAPLDDAFLDGVPPDRYQRELISTRDVRPGHIDKDTLAPVDWWGWAEAIDQVAQRATAPRDDQRPIDLHIATQAPLPLLIQLGVRLTPWGPPATLHSTYGGAWYRLRTDCGVGAADYFARIPTLDRVDRTRSWIALAIDVMQGGVDDADIEDALGDDLGDTLHLAAPAGPLTADNAARFVGHLRDILERYPAHYPRAAGLAIFYKGPAPGAVLLGRQLNPSTHTAVRLYDFHARRSPRYELAVELPRPPRPAPAVDWSDAARLRRHEAHTRIADALRALQQRLEPKHLPPAVPDAEAVIARLARLRLDPPPRPEDAHDLFEFEASTTGQVRFNAPLLDALSSDDRIDVALAAQMFVLHELYHLDQGLYSSTYHGIGRAGFVLEDVDYHADAFAIGTVIDHEVREQGPRGRANQGEIARRCLDTHLRILEAFDRAEQGDRLTRLPERRLRRYLIWHLQRARLRALDGSDYSASDVLAPRLAVELAPLAGQLDSRYDKIVVGPTEHTEMFVSLLGHLVRIKPARGYDPRALVDAIRAFDWAPIEPLMRATVDENRDLLVAWLP